MIKAMLIDDDADDRELFYEAISEIDFITECMLANDVTGAMQQLDAAGNKLPDIFFIDVNMPLIDGWQCLAALKGKAAYTDLPIILYSTSFHEAERSKATALGAIGLMKKPISFEELKENLKHILDHLRNGTLSTNLGIFKAGNQ